LSVLGSCYGHRIFGGSGAEPNQWERLVAVLRSDPQSRRAVLDVYDPDISLATNVKDAPCVCTLQFLIRDDRLHLITYMRSNDVIWGLPYDIFLFTMLQELLSIDVDRPLGTYTHIVGSLHLYEHHFELARAILRNQHEPEFEMPPMAARDELPRFLDAEAHVRSGRALPHDEDELNPYWSSLLAVLKSYRVFKAAASPGQALASIPSGSRYTIFLENLWRSDASERERSGA